MNANRLIRAISFLVIIPMGLTAQVRRNPDPVILKHWAAPLYWQPQAAEASAVAAAVSAPPVLQLVFVAMTPCRVADTRASQGFPSPFGAPSLVGGASRTFPMQASTTCTIPVTAQAYSLNITVVPPGASAGFVTAYPTGQAPPLAATVVWSQGLITSNAAVVPAGSNGNIDVFANSATDIVIDINGYYAFYAPGGVVGPSNAGNTAIGANALSSNTTGFANTADGNDALQYSTTGSLNTAVGAGALNANTAGYSNTAVGQSALNANSTGGFNTASGVGALMSNTTGNSNIAIGFNAAANVAGGNSNNIHIGSAGAFGDNTTIRIGNPGTQTSFFVAGVRSVTTANNNAIPVVIDSAGQLGTVSSSRRFKEDIQDMGDSSRNIFRLRPVTFRYQKPFDDGSKPIQYGLIAEEVAEVFPDLVARSADGQIETVKYQLLDSLLLNEVKRQEEEIRFLKERLSQLERSAAH